LASLNKTKDVFKDYQNFPKTTEEFLNAI